MAKKTFTLSAKLVFDGEFQIMAHSKQEAEDIVFCDVCAKFSNDIISSISGANFIAYRFSDSGQVILTRESGEEDDSEQ